MDRPFVFDAHDDLVRRAPSVVESPGLRRIYGLASRVATSPINVLIVGEPGVGKRTLARWIHMQSQRAKAPLVTFSCAMLEHETEKAMAGTGRNVKRDAYPGAVETASGGTLILESVDSLSLATQTKLIRIIENREITRVGEVSRRPVDVRFISTSAANLEAATLTGPFRADLLHRLGVIRLQIPPLRERPEDLEPLARRFLAEAAEEDVPAPETSAAVLDLFRSVAWPGNLVQLRNVLARALALSGGHEITENHIDVETLRGEKLPLPHVRPIGPMRSASQDERQRIIDALIACGGRATRDQ